LVAEEMTVYHFTDTARLPWILQSGELRPSTNYMEEYPPPNFLWATIDRGGDRSATLNHQHYRSGQMRMVRFTLQAEDFEPWHDITPRYPAWTTEQIERLEWSARSSSALWRWRTEPLPRDRWVAIDTRSHFDTRWKPFPLDTTVISGPEGSLGIKIDDKLYFSKRIDSDGSISYVAGALALGPM
jgi:hypothetical protein